MMRKHIGLYSAVCSEYDTASVFFLFLKRIDASDGDSTGGLAHSFPSSALVNNWHEIYLDTNAES